MPVLLGGALLVLLALVALSASEGPAGRARSRDLLLGVALLAAVVLGFARGGIGWVLALVILIYRLAGERRRAPGARRPGASPTSAANAALGEAEALEVLGLERGASRDEIVAAYRRLVKKVHPDQGGSAYLTRRLTEARDALLGGR